MEQQTLLLGSDGVLGDWRLCYMDWSIEAQRWGSSARFMRGFCA